MRLLRISVENVSRITRPEISSAIRLIDAPSSPVSNRARPLISISASMGGTREHFLYARKPMRGVASTNSGSCSRTEQNAVSLSIPSQETEFVRITPKLSSRASSTVVYDEHGSTETIHMSKEEDNKAVVGRWFTHFWGKTCDLAIVDELAAPNMLLQYSLHAPWQGRNDVKAFMAD